MDGLADHARPMKLSNAALAALPTAVRTPTYDRAQVTPGILHIGLGNFHRAHQAVYMDDLLQLGQGLDWGIVGAGIMPFDAQRRDTLQAQDYLNTVVEMSDQGASARVTGAMIDFCPVSAQALIAQIADPRIRIVSLTITEGGYFIDAVTGEFDKNHPDIIADARSPDSPKTVFGILLAGLLERRSKGFAPPTLLSCDNIPENGHVTRQALRGLAEMISPDLAAWIGEAVAVPNSMVDRITPVTTDETRAFVRAEFGIEDASPVMCEPFRQWVIEDKFPLGRPPLESVGVTFTDDVLPFETMKLRILNAGHASIAYFASLLGIEFVHEAMADPDVANWLTKLMRDEVIPTLQPMSGVDYHAYLQTCVARFGNSAVADTIDRLCHDGSNRQPKFILPTLADALEQNRPIDGLALELALWCRYCGTTDELSDARGAQLRDAAQSSPQHFLGIQDVFGHMSDNNRLREAFDRQMSLIETLGPRGAVRAYLGG